MGLYEDIARSRVETALQEGVESQHAFRDRPARPSRVKGYLNSAKRFTKRISLLRAFKAQIAKFSKRLFVSKSASKSPKVSGSAERMQF